MSGSSERDCRGRNPLYGVLIVGGVAFVITAMGYATSLALEQRPWLLPPGAAQVELDPVGSSPLVRFFRRWGSGLLLAEAGFVAVAAFAAMALDRWQDRQGQGRNAK